MDELFKKYPLVTMQGKNEIRVIGEVTMLREGTIMAQLSCSLFIDDNGNHIEVVPEQFPVYRNPENRSE